MSSRMPVIGGDLHVPPKRTQHGGPYTPHPQARADLLRNLKADRESHGMMRNDGDGPVARVRRDGEHADDATIQAAADAVVGAGDLEVMTANQAVKKVLGVFDGSKGLKRKVKEAVYRAARINREEMKRNKRQRRVERPSSVRAFRPDPPLTFKAIRNAPTCFLSNLYGGAEYVYMSQRTKNATLEALYKELHARSEDGRLTYGDFKTLRKRLQPSSKDNDVYRKVYDGTTYVAWGLLAKLISGCWRRTTTGRKRLQVVNELARQYVQAPTLITHADFIDGTPADKRKWMRKALKVKYAQPFYRAVLDGTGTTPLQEQKGRGNDAFWAGPNGALGPLLEAVRRGDDATWGDDGSLPGNQSS